MNDWPTTLRPAEHRVEGNVLLVDAHSARPMRGAPRQANPSQRTTSPSRQQASDVAFGAGGAIRVPALCAGLRHGPVRNGVATVRHPQPGGQRFTDARPGIRASSTGPTSTTRTVVLPRRDASTVVPSKGNEVYSTRVMDRNGRPVPELVRHRLPGGQVRGPEILAMVGRRSRVTQGTTADLSLGVRIEFVESSRRNQRALVTVRPGPRGASSADAATR